MSVAKTPIPISTLQSNTSLANNDIIPVTKFVNATSNVVSNTYGIAFSTFLDAIDSSFILDTEKGANSGVAPLNSLRKISNTYTNILAADITDSTSAGRTLLTAANVAVQQSALALVNSALIDTTNATNISSGTLSSARLPAFSGDATSSAGASALTLANTNVVAGSYGNATSVSALTVDSKGRLTAASNVAISVLSSAISDSGSFGRSLLATANQLAAQTAMALGALALLSTVATAQIDASAVTYAKIQNISATNRILGRITTGAGVVEELTAANVKTILGITLPSSTTIGRLARYTDTAGAFGQTTGLYEDGSGNVGIGTTSPAFSFHSVNPTSTTYGNIGIKQIASGVAPHSAATVGMALFGVSSWQHRDWRNLYGQRW